MKFSKEIRDIEDILKKLQEYNESKSNSEESGLYGYVQSGKYSIRKIREYFEHLPPQY